MLGREASVHAIEQPFAQQASTCGSFVTAFAFSMEDRVGVCERGHVVLAKRKHGCDAWLWGERHGLPVDLLLE